MPWKFLQRTPVQTIMGQRIPEPRPTLMAVVWALIYLGLPLLVLGTLIDLAIQYTTGVCTGWWCWFG
jgi:hypothetical protein